ncbi:MAG: hypothetical protein K0Q95_1232 [Bacteroidota bacterium]|jgi:hypothetical protein|nr:hypothetical protein [Bacteroidota bacterium]
MIELSKKEEVIIHYKNGKKRLGIILEELKEKGVYIFLPSSSIHNQQRYDHDMLELVPSMLIESIEGDLR